MSSRCWKTSGGSCAFLSTSTPQVLNLLILLSPLCQLNHSLYSLHFYQVRTAVGSRQPEYSTWLPCVEFSWFGRRSIKDVHAFLAKSSASRDCYFTRNGCSYDWSIALPTQSPICTSGYGIISCVLVRSAQALQCTIKVNRVSITSTLAHSYHRC